LVRWIFLLNLIIVIVSAPSRGQLAGRLELDLVARRIPTTVTGEIKLDTPSEFTMLEFAIVSKLDLTLKTGFVDPSVKAGINTAGIESFVFSAPVFLESSWLALAGFGNLSITPEMWVAAPFENVTDVNNLPNSVVIPPGNPLFVSGRVTISTSIAGFNIEHLMMLEDVDFPPPTGSFNPLLYEISDQVFDTGSLTTISWRAKMGLSMTAQLGLSASTGSKSVKGHSATGMVTPGSSFLRLRVGGIGLGRTSVLGIGAQDVMLGASFSVATGSDPAFGTSISISGTAWEGTHLSLSISFSKAPPTVSSILVSATIGPFKMSAALDKLTIEGLSASCGDSLNLGSINGSWSLQASGLERGLTGLAMSLSLAQGVFSTSTSMTLSQRGDEFGFASWSSQLTFRLSPAVVSVQVVFGRYGLTRAAVTTSVSF